LLLLHLFQHFFLLLLFFLDLLSLLLLHLGSEFSLLLDLLKSLLVPLLLELSIFIIALLLLRDDFRLFGYFLLLFVR
jgi:hypothetical protein